MTKLLNLGEVSVQTNIAKLCYVGAKMTINFNIPIVISVKANIAKLCYAVAKTMSNLLNSGRVSAQANMAQLYIASTQTTIDSINVITGSARRYRINSRLSLSLSMWIYLS